MTPTHPLGLIDNPEWAATRYRREELYLAERARLYAKPRRSIRPSLVVLILSVVGLGFALVGGL